MTIQSRPSSVRWAAALVTSLLASSVMAWGPDGHRVVGALALNQMSKHAKHSLVEIMGSSEQETLVEWCNWPDLYRATEAGSWTTPKHYINMFPGESEYEKQRDCSDGMCVTESVEEYTVKLADHNLDIEQRRQAFGWVCHLVGDLHQPLHAGFGHDRGGNDFDVEFNGEPINLHWFWDGALISDRSNSWQELYAGLSKDIQSKTRAGWQASEVVAWTNESHAFAATWSYPDDKVITTEFADQSWNSIGDQLGKGGKRLARVLNTVLGKQCHPPD